MLGEAHAQVVVFALETREEAVVRDGKA
jgi:hypothetical protein